MLVQTLINIKSIFNSNYYLLICIYIINIYLLNVFTFLFKNSLILYSSSLLSHLSGLLAVSYQLTIRGIHFIYCLKLQLKSFICLRLRIFRIIKFRIKLRYQFYKSQEELLEMLESKGKRRQQQQVSLQSNIKI